MRQAMLGLSLALLLMVSSAPAADAPHGAGAATAPHGSTDASKPDPPYPRPALPEPSALAGSTLILILGMFLAAATVGPVVRYHAPEEVPEASSHDEPGRGAHGH